MHQSQTQPLAITPAGALIQMGSQDTHLARKPVLQGACPPEDNSWVFATLHPCSCGVSMNSCCSCQLGTSPPALQGAIKKLEDVAVAMEQGGWCGAGSQGPVHHCAFSPLSPGCLGTSRCPALVLTGFPGCQVQGVGHCCVFSKGPLRTTLVKAPREQAYWNTHCWALLQTS